MNASEMTFGIEIECQIPNEVVRTLNIQIGGYHRGLQVPELPAGWNAQGDCSISYREGFTSIEIVSPVLTGIEGLKAIKSVCEQLNAWGAKVDRSCGLHVHIGWTSYDVRELQKLVRTTSYYEPVLYASTGTHSREVGDYARDRKDRVRVVVSDIVIEILAQTAGYMRAQKNAQQSSVESK